MTHLKIGDPFPDIRLPNHNHRPRQLSYLTNASNLDEHLGFNDGYPLIVVFYRGYFCPRDQQQFRMLVEFQAELKVNYSNVVSIAVQPPEVQAAFRAGLGANWNFLCDTDREMINKLGILDDTEGEYAEVARPFTFVLMPNLSIYKIYDGWYFVGRPTIDELRQDLRNIMSQLSYYPYAKWDRDEIKQIRVPQVVWRDGDYDDSKATETGTIHTFDIQSGNGTIRHATSDAIIFFNFTAIPGEGYRTLHVGVKVRFQQIDHPNGQIARNIQPI